VPGDQQLLQAVAELFRSRMQPQLFEVNMMVKSLRLLFLCALMLGGRMFAQSRYPASPAATGPNFEASVGYVYMSSTSPSLERTRLNGIDATGVQQFTEHWGAMLDLMYARAGNVSHTGQSDNIYSGLIGPVFYLMQRPKTAVFVNALGGVAGVKSAVFVDSNTYFKGYETRFSYAFGGGVERTVIGPFAVRGSADYMRTTFVGSTLAREGQNNIRLIGSVVYRFGRR
jgi:hypothetical protein